MKNSGKDNKYCARCGHFKVCIFTTKINNILNNHSHFFREKGSYSIAGKFAEICNNFIGVEENYPSLNNTLENIEKRYILKTIEDNPGYGNRLKVAGILGIGERTLYRKLKGYGIKGKFKYK